MRKLWRWLQAYYEATHCPPPIPDWYLFPEGRGEAARRLNALAGIDENGGILPPTPEELAAGINRDPVTWWKVKT